MLSNTVIVLCEKSVNLVFHVLKRQTFLVSSRTNIRVCFVPFKLYCSPIKVLWNVVKFYTVRPWMCWTHIDGDNQRLFYLFVVFKTNNKFQGQKHARKELMSLQGKKDKMFFLCWSRVWVFPCVVGSYLDHLCSKACSQFSGLQTSMLKVLHTNCGNSACTTALHEICCHNLPENPVIALITPETWSKRWDCSLTSLFETGQRGPKPDRYTLHYSSLPKCTEKV